ncbi:hypothetical protein LTR37_018100 [Vermiconidia calcicola]|uniref:Uncharacterized protein n=1 Tax=Vermiconidia calcicola TaxID=1690605 RepID=A0ACC3MHX9_9PEZI|nr:hypothetical protein LTR37_018100 [Vermiconidia calcicola]
MRQKPPSIPTAQLPEEATGKLRDEGGLLTGSVEQKYSSTGMDDPEEDLMSSVDQQLGKRYLALRVKDTESEPYEYGSTLSPTIFESDVSISFSNSIISGEPFETWLYPSSRDQVHRRPPTPPKRSIGQFIASGDTTSGATDVSISPIRPAASSPPTPEPVSAISMTESYRSDHTEQAANQSLDVARALSSHPVHAVTSSSLPLPDVSLPHEEFPVRHPSREKEVEIKHPSPRRFASHTVLLQRASSLGSTLYRRSLSDSPGPPPPRSPLRLKRDPETIESILDSQNQLRSTPKVAPSIMDVKDYRSDVRAIKPTVTTDCTGPIKRPKSRGKTSLTRSHYLTTRQEREESTRARKLRDRPYPDISTPPPIIDAIVNAPPPTPRQKLKKARPHIQIPHPQSTPLPKRVSSGALSDGRWKRMTASTRTPVSAVPSEGTTTTTGDKTGYTPISPAASNGSTNTEMALSPVMLVAEEVPITKAKLPSRPAKLVVKEGKPYAPRPRSASIPRSAMKRRSRQGPHTPTRPSSPGLVQQEDDDTPPLPSPPPNRALPPTPPASGSEEPGKAKSVRKAECKKELANLPVYEILPKGTASRRSGQAPHVATQRKSGLSRDNANGSRTQARLEALEKQNALLSAALEAVLRTNGALNAPISIVAEAERDPPMAWETRIARRSAASHAASSSNGSALDMYMSTRAGSRHGR